MMTMLPAGCLDGDPAGADRAACSSSGQQSITSAAAAPAAGGKGLPPLYPVLPLPGREEGAPDCGGLRRAAMAAAAAAAAGAAAEAEADEAVDDEQFVLAGPGTPRK